MSFLKEKNKSLTVYLNFDKMPLQIHEKLKIDLPKLLSEVAVNLESGEDFRKCLAQLHPINDKFRAIMNLTEDSDTLFASYIVLDQLGNVSVAYEGHETSWYQLNAENIKSFRRCLFHYLEKLAKDVSDSDFNNLLDNTKNFLYAFSQHAAPDFIFSCHKKRIYS
jgi:hypothetical protein